MIRRICTLLFFCTVSRKSGIGLGKLAAIGYCFGGSTSLELARSGAALGAVVSFHGGLEAPKPEDNTPNPPLKFRLEKLNRSHPYFTERGINQETVVDFGLGYFTGEKGLMVGHIVIPIHNANGEVVAYAGRWPGEPPNNTPKYKLPPGFKKGQELFNLDKAIKEVAIGV